MCKEGQSELQHHEQDLAGARDTENIRGGVYETAISGNPEMLWTGGHVVLGCLTVQLG